MHARLITAGALPPCHPLPPCFFCSLEETYKGRWDKHREPGGAGWQGGTNPAGAPSAAQGAAR